MAEPLVAFEGVGLRSQEGREVFDRLEGVVRRGERWRLVLERGGGGSALLRLVAGLAHAGEGRVVLDGVPLRPHGFGHPFLRRGAVGWVPQEGELVSNLTLLQNLALPLRFVRGVPRGEAEERAAAMLERVGLADHAGVRPHGLVRREKTLAAMARSTLMEAELWLLDRPFEDLDGRRLARAMELVGEALQRPEVTVLAVGESGPCLELFPDTLRLEGGRFVASEAA